MHVVSAYIHLLPMLEIELPENHWFCHQSVVHWFNLVFPLPEGHKRRWNKGSNIFGDAKSKKLWRRCVWEGGEIICLWRTHCHFKWSTELPKWVLSYFSCLPFGIHVHVWNSTKWLKCIDMESIQQELFVIIYVPINAVQEMVSCAAWHILICTSSSALYSWYMHNVVHTLYNAFVWL